MERILQAIVADIVMPQTAMAKISKVLGRGARQGGDLVDTDGHDSSERG